MLFSDILFLVFFIFVSYKDLNRLKGFKRGWGGILYFSYEEGSRSYID